VPDPQAPATYVRSRIDWRELACEPHASLLDWHRRLIRLRRQLPALADGRMDRVRVRFDENAHWFVLERGPVTVVCNLAAHAQTVPLTNERSRHILLASETEIAVNAAAVTMPAEALVILNAEGR
jgi:maltooligosyltrehalose trehalohydrolase